ncbi:MAG: hypothetical protein CM1200mP41_04810 [Gammaproteobacteria bacterium]|nr:MAG: hypothetical protein CM1200mP41_04810 [Gammaproteobacteria bacterium]
MNNFRLRHSHRQVIKRFGRFPHRNTVLGRSPTKEELDYLASGGETYGGSRALLMTPLFSSPRRVRIASSKPLGENGASLYRGRAKTPPVEYLESRPRCISSTGRMSSSKTHANHSTSPADLSRAYHRPCCYQSNRSERGSLVRLWATGCTITCKSDRLEPQTKLGEIEPRTPPGPTYFSATDRRLATQYQHVH